MSRKRRLKRILKILLHPKNIFCDTKYLFILSHMRSRSTVLSHILGSNPNIYGYRELHISYTGKWSLIEMRAVLSDEFKVSLKGNYLLDKILHNKFDFSKKIVDLTNAKILFLLREPESTIKSIINMGFITGIDWYKDPAKVLDYYTSRLKALAELAEKLSGNYFFLEADELVNNTDKALNDLTKWLNLEQPLSKEYSVFNYTGQPGHGDPSQNITAGVIQKTNGHPEIKIPEAILQEGQHCYQKYKSQIEEASCIIN